MTTASPIPSPPVSDLRGRVVGRLARRTGWTTIALSLLLIVVTHVLWQGDPLTLRADPTPAANSAPVPTAFDRLLHHPAPAPHRDLFAMPKS